jgi:flagellar biosynthesis GTPase FlhF
MQTMQVISDSAASALVQIHKQLGPEAVVFSVRRVPSHGLSRLWQRNGRIEVLAGLPDQTSPSRPERRGIRSGALKTVAPEAPGGSAASHSSSTRRWQGVAWLEAMGLSRTHADRVQRRLQAENPVAPASLDAECVAIQTVLDSFWKPAPPLPDPPAPRTHVFVGPPGSGKTTVLCKWLTLAVLNKERSTCV